jgi:hypothetical protein
MAIANDEKETLRLMIGELEAEEIRRARVMPVMQKVLAGERLYRESRALMAIGFKNRFPEASEEVIRTMVTEQFKRCRTPEEFP